MEKITTDSVADSIKESIVGKTPEDRAINYDAFFEYLKPYYEKGGIEAVSKKLFEMINIEPKWVQESNPRFQEMRQKLHTEGGIAISNHPMPPLDVFSVVRSLSLTDTEKAEHKKERDDCKILVPEEYIKVYRKNFGEEHFVSTAELTTLGGFKNALAHVNSGGLFIIFPTGLQESTDADIEFQTGFSSVIKHIDPDKMIYSFAVDTDDIKTIQKSHPSLLLGIFAEVNTALGQTGNLNSRRPREFFRVDENYSTAHEWQAVANAHGKKDANRALTEFYLSKFKS